MLFDQVHLYPSFSDRKVTVRNTTSKEIWKGENFFNSLTNMVPSAETLRDSELKRYLVNGRKKVHSCMLARLRVRVTVGYRSSSFEL